MDLIISLHVDMKFTLIIEETGIVFNSLLMKLFKGLSQRKKKGGKVNNCEKQKSREKGL